MKFVLTALLCVRLQPTILPYLQQETIALRGSAQRRAQDEGQDLFVSLPKRPQGSVGCTVIHHITHERLVGWGEDNKSTLGELVIGFFRFVGCPLLLPNQHDAPC